MADRSLKLRAKIVPTLGHSTSRFNEQFLDEVCPSEFLRLRAASTDRLREYRFLDKRCSWPSKKRRCDLRLKYTASETVKRFGFFGRRPAFFGRHLCDLCFGIEIRASRGAIP